MLTGSDPYNNDSRGNPDFLPKDILSSGYGRDYSPGFGSGLGVSRLTAGATFKGYETSFEDPNLHGHRRDELGACGLTSGGIRGYQTSSEDPNLHGHSRDGLGAGGLTSGGSIRGYQTSFEDPNLLVHRREGSISGLTAGASVRGYQTSFEDPNLLGQQRGAGPGPGIADVGFEKPNSLRRPVGHPLEAGVEMSNILFVDGLPTDCTRRELGHLFRPFIGFRELRVVHKEPRRRGDKAMVLCFVEFTEAKCALTALEALQGYKFDDKKPDSPPLKIHFAHFPFRLPSDQAEPRV
ncbi:hypothetical protein OROGR_005976 [Orobanche gracilis]